jgi:hypothetical protein
VTPNTLGSFTAGAPAPAVPELAITVADASAEPHAAVPTLRFTLNIDTRTLVPIRAATLVAQLRIAAARRPYDREEQVRLGEVFGAPEQWRSSLRSLYWTHATMVLPPFETRTTAALLVPCTYDFDVVTAKYLHGVQSGDVPLDFLFSGSVFYADDEGMLKTARLSWELEAAYRLPLQVWKGMMDAYFPDSAWLRVRREAFDRLYAFKMEHGLATWEQAIDALLSSSTRKSRA